MSHAAAAVPSYDLLTCGETLLRLSPPGMQRLDQARLFEIGIGGGELNAGGVLARLGRRVAWVSRLPQGPLGRLVDGEARRHGVDTRWGRWIDGARLGLMFLGPGPAPGGGRVEGEPRRHGVDTRWVRWIDGARLGLMFLEPGPAPRNARVIYDRK